MLLDKYIEMVSLKNFDDNLYNAFKRKNRETKNRLVLLLVGSLLILVSIALFNLPLFMCGSFITLGSIVLVIVKDIK